MTTIDNELLQDLQRKYGDRMTYGEAAEILQATQGEEVTKIIAAAFAYGYEKAQKEGTANE